MRAALDGLTIVELGDGVAAAYCGKLFADLGAHVVRIDTAGSERWTRRPGAAAVDAGGRARDGLALHLGTNKHSMEADPHADGDCAMVAAAVRGADLVIETDTRELAGWGVERDALRGCVVRISGFGATGPYSAYHWDDIVVQAVSGSMLRLNDPAALPLRLPGEVAMCLVGHAAALGALAAIMAAERGDPPAFVDCAAAEVLATMPSRQAPLLGYQYRGGEPTGFGVPGPGATLIPTGVFPCADGYVAMMSTAQQLDEMLDVLGDEAAKEAFAHPDAFNRTETKEALDVAVYTWLAARTRAEATAEAQRAGWPLAGVLSPGEVLEADHLHQRGFWWHCDDPVVGPLDVPGPWCRFAEGGWSLRRLAPLAGEASDAERARTAPGGAAARPGVVAAAPLEGVRVVDLTVVWSGPYATMLLADLGAEVIRVENPFVLPPTTKGYHPRPQLSNPGSLGALYGPPLDGVPDRPWNRQAMNNSLARNKLSVTIDTRRPEGLELLMRLAEISDVVIDNFKASGLERMGVDVSELRRRNPQLIVVRLPPSGLTGDWSGYTGFGAQFDALSGFASICGHRDSDPTAAPATTYMDAASGPAGAMAVLAALRYRSATGRGQLVELSQSENVLNHLGDVFIDTQLGVEAERLGNRSRWRAPQGLYPCREPGSLLAVSVADDQAWRALAEIVGGEALAGDGRLADLPGRRTHHDELDERISAWTAAMPVLEAFETLQAAGVAAGPLLDDRGLFEDPHFRAREWFQPLDSGDVGTHLHPGFAFRGITQSWRRGSPTLGEDNEYVYRELLGVSDAEYRRLAEERFLATDYLREDGTSY